MTALTAAHAAALTADVDDAFLAYGADAAGDVDAAFDDAVEQAGYDHGFAGLVPSVASVDADRVTVAGTEPVTLARGLLLAARALHAGDLEPGVAYALPVCPDTSYKRRRVRVVVTDPAVELAETAGDLTPVTDPTEVLLRDLAAQAGADVAADELLETVQVTAARHRYKPIVDAFKGKTVAEFVVLDPATATIVSAGHRTAGEARKAAVAIVKAGPVGGSATGSLEVVKVSRRAEGNPFLRVARTRVGSRVVLKVVFGVLKNPAKTKTTGWLFYGLVGDAAADEVTEAGQVVDDEVSGTAGDGPDPRNDDVTEIAAE